MLWPDDDETSAGSGAFADPSPAPTSSPDLTVRSPEASPNATNCEAGRARGLWEALKALVALVMALPRVSGGPVYLLLAAASPLGFVSAANASIHGA